MPKHKLPAITPAHQAFNSHLEQVEDRTTKYVVPLYGTNEKGQRYVLGSGVLLKIHDEHFLISAAHVFDEIKNPKNATNIELVGEKQLIPIGGSVIKSPLPASRRRKDDKFDIAVVPLNDEMVKELTHFTFLDISQVDPSDRPYLQSHYTFTGYPSTKQKPIKEGTLTIEPVRYTSGPLHPHKYPRGFQLGPHTGIDYSKKRMIARNGQLQTPPDPHGVSGGGIFRLGTYEETQDNTGAETLVGIAIEAHDTCLIGTNITYALEMIRAHYPDLDQQIPHSGHFKVDATKGGANE